MPTYGLTGREVTAAFSLCNSWGAAASVTMGIIFNSTAGMKRQPIRVNDESMGQGFYARGDHGDVEAPDLTFVTRSRFNDWQYIWDSLVMGSPAAAAISTSTSGQTTSYSHIIDPAITNNGRLLTLAFDKSDYIDELISAKPYGIMEAVGDGGVIDKSYKVVGFAPTNISSINVAATIAGASFAPLSDRVFRHQGIFRMNNQAGGSLAASDAIPAVTVELSLERPQNKTHGYGSQMIINPADSGFPLLSLKVTYPRMTGYSASSLYAMLRTNAALKGDLTYTGAFINSTDAYSRKWQFPFLELDDWNGADVQSAQQVKPEATFTPKQALTAPTGMSGVTRPCRLILINDKAAAAF